MVRKQSNAITRMYEELAKTGHQSNMRLTVKVIDGANERFYYDIGIKALHDPFNQLSSTIETGTIDKGKYVSDGHGGTIWLKKFKTTTQPRFLEDFVAKYGKRYIKIHEVGKMAPHMALINTILS